jgi:hypothetical protein
MSTRKPPAPKGEGDGKRPAKRRLTPREGSPKPPKEGWTLEEAFRALAPDQIRLFEITEQRLAEAPRPLSWMNSIGPPSQSPQVIRGEENIRRYNERISAEKGLREAGAGLWNAFRAVMRSGTHVARGRRDGVTGAETMIEADQWEALDVFDLQKSAVAESGGARSGFVAVRVFGATVNRGGRPPTIQWSDFLVAFLLSHVGSSEFETGKDLIEAVQKAFEAAGRRPPSERSVREWLMKTTPKFYTRACEPPKT